MSDVARAYPSVFIRYGRGLRDYVITAGLSKPRDFKTEVHVITGPPGCGKSKWCKETAAMLEMTTYWKPKGKWWDGYCDHEVVILDDLYGWLPLDEMLRIMDRYPYRVETKGGTANFVAKYMYITSNKPVKEWYQLDGDNEVLMRALFRRIDSYAIMDKDKGLMDKRPTLFPINC